MFISGRWYEIRLPYGKKFSARYSEEHSGSLVRWFYFSDGSRKLVQDITPYAVEIVEISEPEHTLNILDFLDDEEDL